MAMRWRVLALLFTVRAAMAFQFQAVGALSPFMREAYGVSIADIGLLIGLYFAPGLALALPGGALGRRFGDKQMVLVGLFLMAAGGGLMAGSTYWPLVMAGRLVAGVGGVLLNVLMTKMVTDWFAGREISFSMALFVNSWPAGIALALIFLPAVEGAAGLLGALLVVLSLVVAGFLLMALFYRTPDAVSGGPARAAGGVVGSTLTAVIAAGLIWGLYNAALTIVFSFGPELFATRGLSVEVAGSMTSIVLWMLVVAGPLGGWLIDRTGQRDLVLAVGVLLFAVLLWVGTQTDQILLLVLVLGFCTGIPVGAIMSLPAAVLAPEDRAVGMGIFFTLFYLCGMATPPIAGWVAEATGDISATFMVGVAQLLICLPLLLVFRRRAAHARARTSTGSS